MNRFSAHAIELKLARQAARANFGVGKYDDLLQTTRFDEMHHCGAFRVARHGIRDLRDRISRGVSLSDFEFDRAIEVCTRQLADFVTKRRRKQQCLALSRQ